MKKNNLLTCYKKIKPFIHRTPVLKSTLLNEMTGAELYFKCENFQRMGAFKFRGAIHALINLSEEQKLSGVVTHSSGNFAQALSLAAKNLNIRAYIAMPFNAPLVKKNAVTSYGGEIIECESTQMARETTARQVAAEKGATLIHPSNDMDVILGQGTAALELLQDYPDLEHVIAPVGGGGLISGTALYARHFAPQCKIYGGEPFEADDAYRSLRSGKIEHNETTNTIADGLRTNLGENTFATIREHVNSIIRVTEEEIITSMKLIWERMKIVIEPSGAVAFAAVLKEKSLFKNSKTGVILSGGNVDLAKLPF